MWFEIDEWNNCIERVCRCGYKEEIEFYYLHFERKLDEEEYNCHHVHRCPRCRLYYDIVLDADDSESGEEVMVNIVNYRKKECLIDHLVDKGVAKRL